MLQAPRQGNAGLYHSVRNARYWFAGVERSPDDTVDEQTGDRQIAGEEETPVVIGTAGISSTAEEDYRNRVYRAMV